MRSFWQKNRPIVPWLLSREGARLGAPGEGGGNDHGPVARERELLTPDPVAFHNVDACIQGGACVAACTPHQADGHFLGPAALPRPCRFVVVARAADVTRCAR